MTVKRAIEKAAFNGKRVFKAGARPDFKYVASGTGTESSVGVLTYDVSGEGVYIAIDAAGTGTQINA